MSSNLSTECKIWLGLIRKFGLQHEVVPSYKALSLILVVALLTSGCTNRKPPPINPAESTHPHPSALIVAPAKYEPQGKLNPILITKGKAAAGGAAEGAVGGAGGAALSTILAAGTMGPLAVMLLPIVVPAGAVAGAAYGSAHETSMAASKETIKKGRQALEKVIDHLQLQRRLQQSIVTELRHEGIANTVSVNEDIGPSSTEARPNYQQINGPMVLEVSVKDFGFSRGITSNDKYGYRLDMMASARLVDTKRHVVVDELQHVYHSEARTAAEWLQDNAQGFMQAVDEGIQNTSSDIVLEFFLLYYPPHRIYKPSEKYKMIENIKPFPDSVLKPISPSPTFKGYRFSAVNSLQPNFRWQAFPRPVDLSGAHDHPKDFQDVTYEIEIFRAIRKYDPKGQGLFYDSYSYAAGPLIYARSGLQHSWFRLETPLKPCGKYAWTVRAHFLLDGKPRVTEWTGMYGNGSLWLHRHYAKTPFYVSTIIIEEPKRGYPLFRTPPAAGIKKCAK